MRTGKTVRIAVALFILGFVILVHEFGHFVTCKFFGIETPTFSIGFGPPLIQKKIGNTTFQIAMLPLGGYVSMNALALQQAPYWQKMVITLAGIFNNFLLAFLLLSILFFLNRARFKPSIEKIIRGSPAAQAGLQRGDRITHIDGVALEDNADLLLQTIQEKPNKLITCTLERDGILHEFSVHIGAKTITGATIGYVGITLTRDYSKSIPLTTIIYQTGATVLYMIQKSFYFLTTFFRPETRQAFTGPIGIVTLTAQNLQRGFSFFLFFIASISIELGVFNVLPIPLLDGGQAFYYTIEALIGHALSAEELTLIHFVYLLILIMLIIYLNRKARTKKNN